MHSQPPKFPLSGDFGNFVQVGVIGNVYLSFSFTIVFGFCSSVSDMSGFGNPSYRIVNAPTQHNGVIVLLLELWHGAGSLFFVVSFNPTHMLIRPTKMEA